MIHVYTPAPGAVTIEQETNGYAVAIETDRDGARDLARKLAVCAGPPAVRGMAPPHLRLVIHNGRPVAQPSPLQ